VLLAVVGCGCQGGILNFEVLRPDGGVFSYKTFEREAAEAGFHVRTGAECNPGACYNYLGVQVKPGGGGCWPGRAPRVRPSLNNRICRLLLYDAVLWCVHNKASSQQLVPAELLQARYGYF
jgi:hypothetical protein